MAARKNACATTKGRIRGRPRATPLQSRLWWAPLASGLYRVNHQHGDRQGADSAGHGCVCAGDLRDVGRVNVADKYGPFLTKPLKLLRRSGQDSFGLGGVRQTVGAYVQDGCAVFDEVAGNHGRSADSGDEDIRLSCNSRQVRGSGVTDRYRGVLVEKQQGGRFADDIAAADHDGAPAGDRNAAAFEDFDQSGGRARDQSRLLRD